LSVNFSNFNSLMFALSVTFSDGVKSYRNRNAESSFDAIQITYN